MNLKFDSGKVFSVLSNLRLETINPFLLMATGALLLVLLVFMLFAGGTSQHENDDVLAQAQKSLKQVSVAPPEHTQGAPGPTGSGTGRYGSN